MSDFSKTILKWIVVGLIIILAIILLTNLINSNSKTSSKNNELVDNVYESGTEDNDSDYDLEPIEDSTEDDPYMVYAPDTASNGNLITLIGLLITSTGIIYTHKKRIRKSN